MQTGNRRTTIWTLLCSIGVLLVAFPAAAQVCGPLDDGRIATPFYEGTTIFWDPLLEYEEIRLTITGPCEDIVRTFGSKDAVSFDIREVERIVDGQYRWTLQRVPRVDEGVRKTLKEARDGGNEDEIWWSLFQSGKLPEGPFTDSGSFIVERGLVIDPSSGEEKSIAVKRGDLGGDDFANGLTLGGALADSSQIQTKATVLTNADGVIRNSLCVGFDCPNNPTFSDSTILLTENNTRIKFDDTSTAGSFPRNDWEIEANSNLNGGLSYLAFNDCGQSSGGGCAEDLVFGVEAGARQHALWVESDGDVGLGTQNPVLRLHMTDGDTPALRLEQDGSSGFEPQTWDIAGNEASFFVRDATNGSTLPFRIRPGAASNSLVIDDDDNVGIGILNATAALHVRRSAAAEVLIDQASTSTFDATIRLQNASTSGPAGQSWVFNHRGNNANFLFNYTGTPGNEFQLDTAGNLILAGSLTVGPGGCTGCDLVFSPDYEVESIEEHAAYMWQNSHLPGVGPTPEDQPMNISQKTGGILNELEKAHIYIEQLHRRIAVTEEQMMQKVDSEIEQLRQQNAELLERLARLESAEEGS